MRIISGIAGSVPLQVPKSLTRPTTDRVRESLFSVLGELTVGARVLDLFAGTGSLGLEALSRGAAAADFVESQAAACEVIRKNLEKTRLAGGQVHRRDVFSFLAPVPPGRYHLVFADPPYAREEPDRETLARLLENEALAAALAPGGLLVLETLASEPLPASGLWSRKDERGYGTTRISFLAPAG
jgi:16S rRNA (guanine966-N2)-methyltransferase